MKPASLAFIFSGLLAGGLACSGSSSSASFLGAVSDVMNAALKCEPGAAGGALALDSIAASACNQAQASYVGLHYAELTAYTGRCFCIEAYYNKATTIGDVGLWVECVSPWNTLAVTNGRAIAEFENTHSDVFATCNVCTVGSPFPAMDPRLEQVLAVLEFIMDWRDKLQEAEIEFLKEGLEAVVISAALGNKGVPNGVSSPTVDWIVSTITQGQSSSGSSSDGRSLRARQANNGTATNTTSPMISKLIGVQVKLRMVPVNVTASVLEDQMKKLFAGPDFASNLTVWNANLTSASYSTVYGNGSSTASPTGTTPSGSAATPSPTKGLASSLLPPMMAYVSVGFVVALFALLG